MTVYGGGPILDKRDRRDKLSSARSFEGRNFKDAQPFHFSPLFASAIFKLKFLNKIICRRIACLSIASKSACSEPVFQKGRTSCLSQ